MRLHRTLSVIFVLSLGGCVESPTDPVEDHQQSRLASREADSTHDLVRQIAAAHLIAARAGRDSTSEDVLLAIEAEAPGFAGLYQDTATRQLVVVATSEDESARAIGAIRRMTSLEPTSSLRQLVDGAVTTRRGSWSFSELVAWRDVLRPQLLSNDGVVMIDADEFRNAVSVAVLDDATTNWVYTRELTPET